jgi:hypothetical protein
VRKGPSGLLALQKLGPRQGLLVTQMEASRPESIFLITHSVRDWCWNAQNPGDEEAYATWLRAREAATV